MFRFLRRSCVAAIMAALLFSTAMAQPPAGAPAAAPRGGGFSQPAPSDWSDHNGWKQIFDGQSLTGWNCDAKIWSVADGAITAKSTAERPTGTTYCSWMGGEPADFELKLEFRILVGGNSGVQYRSVPQPPRTGAPGGIGGPRPAGGAPGTQAVAPAPPATALPTAQPCQMQMPVMLPVQTRMGGPRGPGVVGPRPDRPYDVGGYQYDFDSTGNYPGSLYENGMATGAPAGTNNRGIITYKGQVVHLLPDARRETIGCVADATGLKGVMDINIWLRNW